MLLIHTTESDGNESTYTYTIDQLIENLNQFKIISIYHQNLTNEQVKKLADALATNNTVAEIDINSCNLDDDAANELANMLKQNRKINKLNLRKNQITDLGVSYFVNAIKENLIIREIDLHHNDIKAKHDEFERLIRYNRRTIRKVVHALIDGTTNQFILNAFVNVYGDDIMLDYLTTDMDKTPEKAKEILQDAHKSFEQFKAAFGNLARMKTFESEIFPNEILSIIADRRAKIEEKHKIETAKNKAQTQIN